MKPHLAQHAFKPGDPRAAEAARKPRASNRKQLMKRLKALDDQAWDTFNKLFQSAEPQHALEALKIWAKYRLHVLTTPVAMAEQREELPRMSPEFARRIMEALDS